jgi:SAM-dependent methyltransferase
VLRCPSCHSRDWHRTPPLAISCGACGRTHPFKDGILHVQVPDEHPEVVQERASVGATEREPGLGGWKDEGYAPAADPASAVGQAYLSLPYGDGSHFFREPGYFANVSHFAPEFDFILQRLPHSGVLLDLGADGTWSTARLSRRGLSCIALDITDHLALARLFQTASPPYALVNVDMHAPVFADQSFDVVTAFNAMHHSRRLDELAHNIVRALKPGGVLAFIEPYVQNAEQEAAFGKPQTAQGINENVHTLERWHRAFVGAGLELDMFSVSDSFNAVYVKPASGVASRASGDGRFERFYHAELDVSPPDVSVPSGVGAGFVVTITRRGPEAWTSRGPQPICLSYHVSRETPQGIVMVSFDNDRTRLPGFVSRDQPIAVHAPVQLSQPGRYTLEFDLVHEGYTWFKQRGATTATAHITVT